MADSSQRLAALRKAIPSTLFQSSLLRSISFVLRDVLIIAALYAAILALQPFPVLWLVAYPVFVLAAGTMFWALFVLGHDCGHGSFSRSVSQSSLDY
jgi:omega-3 fatty acid desaturase (delta-15 desaturase)